MNEIPRSQRFSPERSAAIEALLANVAQEGTPENRHFQNTKGKRILISGVAVALAGNRRCHRHATACHGQKLDRLLCTS
jgi:hypothetical protein